MSYHSNLGASMVEATRIPAYQRPRIDASYFGRGIPGMLAPRGTVTPLRGMGQLSMDPQTAAALKACSDKCDSQFGVPSGKPDFISLTTCFANCNLQFPPTVAIPGGGTVTPPAIPGTAPGAPALPPPPEPVPPIMPGVEPTEPTAPAATKASAGGDMKLWVIGGAVALLAVGAFAYSKRKR